MSPCTQCVSLLQVLSPSVTSIRSSYPPLLRPSESTAQYRWPGLSYLVLNQRHVWETCRRPPDSHQHSTDTAAMLHLKHKHWLITGVITSTTLLLLLSVFMNQRPILSWFRLNFTNRSHFVLFTGCVIGFLFLFIGFVLFTGQQLISASCQNKSD